ncbi:putative serine/threonine protein phosphatase [Actinoplanes missouriensis 431]|uniref:Putative serine/threonine protein phosphatase n=1 Tax=Actinoplanes missouriensis (strain ATCC 14538 / DSM 43046 / CBS 188.64 / JCM 3121 / NBRC 102363 / NCIMB 12654 / NRRL B-3342 / UNCC 431) TaxID=512565 RepID=I0HF17_ACTM4|nr:protein phosphatase 2C domain-containing protein [Actinoplanes missouriensis]BAL91604.1 putative serine/threonine protein phosphatase [Actinoplanes missouriensis 431]
MTLQLRWAAVTDQGHVRSNNEDCHYAGDHLLVVCDGMGGMAAGDLASRLAIEAMVSLDAPIPTDLQMDALHRALEVANGRIAEQVAADPSLQGMGTTLTAVLFNGERAAMAHVGDSRAYLLRDGRLNQLTKDDTYVQMLIDQGLLKPEEAAGHPRRAVVTRVLQGEPVTPAYVIVEPQEGDRWLLCSDGLTGVVTDATLEQELRAIPDPKSCSERLVDLALRGGGPDNVTVVVADVTAAV